MDLKTVFVISVLTSKMIMPGMSDMPGGMKIPGFGSATRSMTMELTSDKSVNSSSKAQCAVPEGLLVGPKVDLKIDLPEKATGGAESAEMGKAQNAKFKIKSYWECGDTVQSGQPLVFSSDDMKSLSAADKARYEKMMKKSMARYSDDYSHAYWPWEKSKKLETESATPGFYELTTNYCGGTAITLDKPQNFLAPIELVSPGKGGVDLEKTIMIDWKPVPNAEAYIITAFASAENEMVSWTSSSDPKQGQDYSLKAMTHDEVKKYVEKGIFLPPDKTSCRIPAGIFKGMKSPMLMLTAIGSDKIQDKDGIETQVIVRSTATAMLGGGMDMGGDDENVSEDNSKQEQKDEVKEQQKSTDKSDDSVSVDDATNKANSDMNKVDRVKDTINRAKGLFKR